MKQYLVLHPSKESAEAQLPLSVPGNTFDVLEFMPLPGR